MAFSEDIIESQPAEITASGAQKEAAKGVEGANSLSGADSRSLEAPALQSVALETGANKGRTHMPPHQPVENGPSSPVQLPISSAIFVSSEEPGKMTAAANGKVDSAERMNGVDKVEAAKPVQAPEPVAINGHPPVEPPTSSNPAQQDTGPPAEQPPAQANGTTSADVPTEPEPSEPALSPTEQKAIADLEGMLARISQLDVEGWFQNPVRESDAPNYHKIIKQPMCFHVSLPQLPYFGLNRIPPPASEINQITSIHSSYIKLTWRSPLSTLDAII